MQQVIVEEKFDFQFKDKYHWFLVGRSMSGKTSFLLKLLQNRHKLGLKYEKCILFYNQNQPIYTDFEKTFSSGCFLKVRGLPENLSSILDDFNPNNKYSVSVIFDDLMVNGVFQRPEVCDLFISGRHRNFSVFILAQNIFPSGTGSKNARSIILNSSIIAIFNMRDISQISRFARNIFGSKRAKIVVEAFTDCVRNKSYGYLVVDLQPTTPVKYSLRSSIFAEENCIIVYDESQV